jgi:hypothetical protein
MLDRYSYKMNRMLENQAFKDILCWGHDGTTFIVKDTNEFSRTILPKHFKHCNFASFVRQLNKYDFHKVRNGDDGQKLYGDQASISSLITELFSLDTNSEIGLGVCSSKVYKRS